jgi:ribonuclease HI
VALTLHVDGGSRGNPGPAGAGVVISDEGGRAVFEAGFFIGHQTNNAAEYLALIRALQQATALGAGEVHIVSDSELLVRQLTGEYRVKNPKLEALYEQVQMLLLKVPRWQVRHVRREHNQRADELANLAMDRRADVIVTGQAATPQGAGAAAAAADASAAGAVSAEPRPRRKPRVAEPTPGADEATSAAPPLVQVRVTHAAADTCPAGGLPGAEFTLGATLPAGLCIYAAHALLPTLLAVHDMAAGERGAVPTMTVRCTRAGCGATLQVTPVRVGNGQS